MKLPVFRTQNPLGSFLVIAAVFQAIGGFIGIMSGPGPDGWYDLLAKSPLTPPGAVFAIVWPCLYLLLSYAFWAVIRAPEPRDRSVILRLFCLHMILNWAWNPLFFLGHQLFASYLLILALIFTAAMLLWLIWPLRRSAALVFLPYLAWLTFAGHLAYFIWKNN